MKSRALVGGALAALACGLMATSAAAAQPAAPKLSASAQQHLTAARKLQEEGKAWAYGPLIMCYQEENRPRQQIVKIPPATKVFDNLYFVGMGTVSAWVVQTSAGLILIDTLDNAAEAEQYILGGMAKFGLNPQDIKYIVITHGHGDHYGGAKFLQDKIPGAKVVLTGPDYDLAEKNAANPRGPFKTPAPRRDIVSVDGQKLTLGDTTMTIYVSPGHTPASQSLILPVKDHGVPHTLALWGGSGPFGLNHANHILYDQSVKRFIGIAQAAKADGLFATHPPLDDSAAKISKLTDKPNDPNPFLIGADEVLRNYRIFEQCNLYQDDILPK